MTNFNVILVFWSLFFIPKIDFLSFSFHIQKFRVSQPFITSPHSLLPFFVCLRVYFYSTFSFFLSHTRDLINQSSPAAAAQTDDTPENLSATSMYMVIYQSSSSSSISPVTHIEWSWSIGTYNHHTILVIVITISLSLAFFILCILCVLHYSPLVVVVLVLVADTLSGVLYQ